MTYKCYERPKNKLPWLAEGRNDDRKRHNPTDSDYRVTASLISRSVARGHNCDGGVPRMDYSNMNSLLKLLVMNLVLRMLPISIRRVYVGRSLSAVAVVLSGLLVR
jgi:hypothetical protein